MTVRSIIALAALPTLFVCSAANAQLSTSSALGAPAVLGGDTVSGAAAGHAGVAPTVNQVLPAAEPATDGVTNALAAAGTGLTGTGQNIQANGLTVGTTGNGRPVASVGVNDSRKSGTVVGVLNPAHGQNAATVGSVGTARQGAIASVLNR